MAIQKILVYENGLITQYIPISAGSGVVDAGKIIVLNSSGKIDSTFMSNENDLVPLINSADNILMRDVVGNKTDDENGNSVYSLAHMLHEHIHSKQQVYPTLANGVTITGAAGAWVLGNFSIVIPANTITRPFDIHHVNVASYNANDTFELVFYYGSDGSEIEAGRVRFSRATNTGATPNIPMMSTIIPANSQVKAKIATQNGTSNTATISIMYHTY